MEPNQPTNASSNAPSPIDPYYGEEESVSTIKKILPIVIGIIIFIILVAIIVFVLGKIRSGGGNGNGTLTYWGIWEDAKVMQPIIDDFERTHPGVKVKYEKQDIKGLGKYIDRLTSRINSGSGPDIYRFHSSWTLQLKNYLLPFPKSLVDSTEIEKDYYKAVQKDLSIKGAYFGIPLGVDTLALFVNTEMLQNVALPTPRDWNDIVQQYGPRLLVKEGNQIITSSIALGTYDNIAHAPDIMAMIFLQNGANIKDLTRPTNKNSVDALTFYTSFSQNATGTWNSTLDNSKLAFAKGKLAMYFGYSWDIFEIKAINPNLKFQVVPAPTLAGRKNTVASYWVEGVSSKTKHSKEAFEFIEYLSKPDTLKKLYAEQSKIRLFGLPYPRRSMQKLLSDNELIYPFVLQADNAESTFFSSDTHDGETGMISKMNVYLGNAIRSIRESASEATAIDTLAKGVAQVLKSYEN